ncbi:MULTISPECIES: stage II sporulation protein M [Burkholderiaceae]|uniref:stage II sporulation protein M n=1 Tax=Burkholderiaceae TaxID=119060 RepID=UPI00163F3306|nr:MULTISPECIES: stage II sporulation protein M [Burkholderiaceae]
MKLLREALSIIRTHKNAYLLINVAFYGLLIVMMAATCGWPELQAQFKPGTQAAFDQPGLFKTVGELYASRNLLLAMALTFGVNLIVASLLLITLPSLILPFIGIAMALFRAYMWGVNFAPTGPLALTLIPHSLTLLIEGQAYVLAGFAAYVQGRQFLWPARYNLLSKGAGYKAGIVSTLKIFVLIAIALAIGAVYEVLEAVYIMPHLVKH